LEPTLRNRAPGGKSKLRGKAIPADNQYTNTGLGPPAGRARFLPHGHIHKVRDIATFAKIAIVHDWLTHGPAAKQDLAAVDGDLS